jgi:hypothetical protein
MTLHINLGLGNDYKQGFINIDIANTKADIVGRMEDFVPKEIVRYVEARWSFSFLDEPKAILVKYYSGSYLVENCNFMKETVSESRIL